MIKTLIALFLAVSAAASADTITFVFEGTLSGSLDGNQLTDEPFVYTASADTNNIVAFQNGYSVLNNSLFLDLLGNHYTVLTSTSTFVNQANGEVGMLNEQSQSDFLDGPFDSVFNSWDLLSSIGPVTSTSYVVPTTLQTSGGILEVVGNRGATVTFTATTAVPEPASAWLLWTALAGIGALGAMKRGAFRDDLR